MDEFSQDISLENISNGGLQTDFADAVTKIMERLPDGEKGKISITIELSRVKGAVSMLEISSKVSATLPATKRRSLGSQFGDGIKVAEPEQIATLFTDNENKNVEEQA